MNVDVKNWRWSVLHGQNGCEGEWWVPRMGLGPLGHGEGPEVWVCL